MTRWRIAGFTMGRKGVYQFFWGDFCDWYIEWVKPDLQSADKEARCRMAQFICGV